MNHYKGTQWFFENGNKEKPNLEVKSENVS